MLTYQTICLENGKAKRFWEIEFHADDKFFYTRQGEIGALGRCSWDFEEKPEVRHEKVMALAEGMRAKGYVDAEVPPIPLVAREPELLPGEPLSAEQLARFTSSRVEHPSREQCAIWEREMPKFLRKSVYEGAGRLDYIGGRHVLAQEFEDIAALDSPLMAKEVERDPRGMVVEIRYYIGGLRVLRLRNQHLGFEENPPIRPFFSELETHMGFKWGKRKRMVDEARALLTGFPAFCAEFLTQVGARADDQLKEQKIRTVAQTSIEVMVEDLMRGSGHTYRLARAEKSNRLLVRLSDDHQLALSLPHRTFLKRTGEVLDTIALVKELYEGLPVRAMLTTGGSRYEWGTVRWHESYYNPSGPREEFWWERMQAYEARVLRRTTEPLDLEVVASWEIPGVRMEQEMHGRKIRCVNCWVEDRRVLSLAADIYQWNLAHRQYTPKDMPSPADWRGLLEGLPEFYRAGQAEFERRFQDVQWADMVRATMGGLGYEWTLNLGQPEHAQLSVRLPQRRMLALLIPYERIEAQCAVMGDTIARVLDAMRRSKLAFKIEPNVWREAEWRKG